MANKCLNPNFKTSEASTKAWMRTRNLIDRYLNILDTDGFRKANKKWSEHAQQEYGTEGMLFQEENNKAFPNKEAFKKIDQAKDITYEQRTSAEDAIDVDEFEQQRKAIAAALGFEVVYNRDMDVSGRVKGNKIEVNPDKIFRDTLIHEIGHILIDSIGGLSNPLVRRGIQQLEGTALSNRVKEQYKDQPDDIIQKEILATAIGQEGADLFGDRQDRISKWKKWLNLFLSRVKQVLGIDPTVAQTMAREIVFNKPELNFLGNTMYEQRGYSKSDDINALEDTIEDTITRLKAEIDRFKRVEIEGYRKVVGELQDLVGRLTSAKLEVGVRSYIEIANARMESLEKKVDQDNLTFEQLRQINDYLGPYQNVGALIENLNALNLENPDELTKSASNAVATIDRIQRKYLKKLKINTAERLMTAENGTIHIRYKEQFEEEFDKKNLDKGYFKDKTTLNGEVVSKGKYRAAKNKYVSQKMDANREKIEQEEYQHLRETFDRTPGDIGVFEAFAYESGNINDEIIQVVTELFQDADTQTRSKYIAKEGEFYEAFQKLKKKGGLPANQKKRWGFLLADELDENGNPTGEKMKYFSRGDYNPSFVLHKRRLWKEMNDAMEREADMYGQFQDGNATEAQYKQAVAERKAAEKKRTDWLKKNTNKYGGMYKPIEKWRDTTQLTQEQQEIKDLMMDTISEIEDNYPPMGALTSTDVSSGIMITKLPSVNKTTTERILEENLLSNIRQAMKDFFNPKTEETEFVSMNQLEKDNDGKIVAKTRDNKIHHHIPIPFRKDTDDQSFDVFSALLMDYHMSLNYEHKRNIEAEVLGMLDIARHRDVAETRSSFGNGVQAIKNFFNDDRQVNKKETSRIYDTLRKLIDARMYGVRRQGNEKINKIADQLIGFSSLVIMPANVFSAVSNVVMGRSNSAIDIFGEKIASKEDFVKAEKEYVKSIPKTIGEAWKPKKQTKVNKIMEYFDIMGDFYGPTMRFAEDSWFKNTFNRGTLYALQTMVEHYIHGTTGIGVLMSMKLQNKNGDYINKEGKKVDDANKAANMYDYLDLIDGEVAFGGIPNAYKTDQFDAKLDTPELNKLVKNKIRDFVAQTQGQYDNKEFAVSELSIWARMFFHLREWIPRGFERHWRGASYIFAEEIPEHAKLTSRQGAKTKTGIQTQFLHTSVKSLRPLKDWITGQLEEGEKLSFDMLKQPWSELTTVERQNVRRAIITYGLAAVMTASVYALQGLDSDADDIPDELVYLIFALERAKQELLFFSNPAEALKILKSPAAGVSTLRSFVALNQQVASDIFNGEMERYERGERKGQPKLKKDITDLLPVFSQLNRDTRTALSYIQSIQQL